MGKYYHYFITEGLKEMLSRPIRKKNDILKILLEISSYLLVNDKPVDRGIGEFIVKVDKMSRVFITLHGDEREIKHYSFNFPFIIEDSEENEGFINLKSNKNRIKVDSMKLSVLRSVSATGWFSDEGEISSTCMLEHYETLEIIIKEIVGPVEKYIDEVWLLIKELILIEPGYLRYDYDPVYQKDNLHPLHHIDINYTNHITFKLGLESKYLQKMFIDLLDTNTNCHYLA
ncbi:hypothetical protein [Paenibacillus odorifer]|uniref:hypothetical protein n=1 Tax=Paenibacillus odorifer TaxID=189426 RepID=UPI00096EE57C|nr:hypothetical protein [Paenibacillus odorifer]